MICPECKADNLAGKILCYKCGAKLAPGGIPQGDKKAGRKKRGLKSLLPYLFSLIFLGIVFYFMSQKVNIEPLETSPQAAQSLKNKLKRIEKAASAKKPVRVEVTQKELNSLVAEQWAEVKVDEEYAKKNIKVDDIQMRFEGEKLESLVTMKVKGKPICVSLTGKVGDVDGKLTLSPDEIKIGKLPVPARIVQRAMKRVERERGSLAFLDLPPGVRDIRIEGGKLIIEAGPEATATVLIEDGMKQSGRQMEQSGEANGAARRKRGQPERQEANSWLQVGNNFANMEMYDSALEYYQKVIDKYPESQPAQEARKRIEEMKAKLTSKQSREESP